MEIAVVAIAKNENDYINEWCHHYINLGFTHIYLYDNNDKETPFVGDFIDQELMSKITIIDYRGLGYRLLQQFCYRDCYYRHKFDWLLFCDIDEFLVGIDNIQEFLSQEKFNDFDQIKIQWQLFDDNDLIERDIKIPVVQAFTRLADYNIYHYRLMSKSIIRGGITGVMWSSVHVASLWGSKGLKNCLPSGKACNEAGLLDDHIKPFDDYSEETVFINHYITKTLKEFLDNKYLTQDPCFIGRTRTLNYFWKHNKRTPEKEAYIEKYLKEHNLKRVNINATFNT